MAAATTLNSCCFADFDYNTGSSSLQPGNINLPGQVHQGFARVAESLWGGVAAALQALISVNGQLDNVYVAGHSLGAGVATLISYGAQVGGLSLQYEAKVAVHTA